MLNNVPDTFKIMLIIIPVSIILQLHLHNVILVPVSKQTI